LLRSCCVCVCVCLCLCVSVSVSVSVSVCVCVIAGAHTQRHARHYHARTRLHSVGMLPLTPSLHHLQPPPVRYVKDLEEKVRQLEERNQYLLEQLAQAKNSLTPAERSRLDERTHHNM
jgi:hypothetical protein